MLYTDNNNFQFNLDGWYYRMCNGELIIDDCLYEAECSEEMYSLARAYIKLAMGLIK